jgi:hypothetical protein
MASNVISDQEHLESDESYDLVDAASAAVPEPESAAVLTAAFTMFRASEQLAALDAESRAVARLAAEALMRGDVSRAALALVAQVEGRSGILALLRGSAQAQPD